MSEIPEHLLKRSRSAKASKGGETGDDATPTAADLPNLDPEPVPAKPDAPYVVAAKSRRRIPVWALPIIAALPVWAIAFPGTMQQPKVEDPLITESTALYTSKGCSGCHGASGGGGTGYQLSDGSVLQTFPQPIDQMVHVARGSAAIQGQPYGAVRADGAQRVAGAKGSGQMPAQEKQVTLLELQMVVYHERVDLSGEKTNTPEYKAWITAMEAAIAKNDKAPVDLKFLLDCATVGVTPGATGAGSPDPKAKPCPGPVPAASDQAALGG